MFEILMEIFIQFITKTDYIYRKRKGGGCLFHGGLAHNCDYKDLVGAVDETDHWGSDMSPGKVNHIFETGQIHFAATFSFRSFDTKMANVMHAMQTFIQNSY